MPRACLCSASNLFSNLANTLLFMQKRVVAFPLQPNQDAEATSLSNVQKPVRRRVVGAHGIHAVCSHLREILLNYARGRERSAVYARAKCSVSHASDKKLLLANP